MSESQVKKAETKKPGLSYWILLILTYLLIPAILFLCAWDLRWWQGWVYTLLIFLAGVLGRSLAEKRHPGLMRERRNSESNEGVKPWDKVSAPLMAFSIGFPLVIVVGLDHKNGWTAAFPTWLVLLGFVLIAGGYFFADWALLENRNFSGTVRIQSDRGHQVCDTGPYRFVRHPGYLGNLVPLAGIVLALGSLWTIIPAAFAAVVILVRTALEDRTLRAELPGYAEYAARVRWRLLPGLW